jgi:hypothetical protein
MNKFEFWINFGFEQIQILNKFWIWTNLYLNKFEFEQMSDLNKFWIWTIFRFEQISDLNSFLDLNNFWISFFFQIWTNLEN